MFRPPILLQSFANARAWKRLLSSPIRTQRSASTAPHWFLS
nr:MAG TPA: hypothetical protein [Caudoviricetes sp.]